MKRPTLISAIITTLSAASCSPSSSSTASTIAITSGAFVLLSLVLVGCGALVSYNSEGLKIRIPLSHTTDNADSEIVLPSSTMNPNPGASHVH